MHLSKSVKDLVWSKCAPYSKRNLFFKEHNEELKRLVTKRQSFILGYSNFQQKNCSESH